MSGLQIDPSKSIKEKRESVPESTSKPDSRRSGTSFKDPRQFFEEKAQQRLDEATLQKQPEFKRNLSNYDNPPKSDLPSPSPDNSVKTPTPRNRRKNKKKGNQDVSKQSEKTS